jgi:hypothetical protein
LIDPPVAPAWFGYAEEAVAGREIDARILAREDRHAEEALIELDGFLDVGHKAGDMVHGFDGADRFRRGLRRCRRGGRGDQ